MFRFQQFTVHDNECGHRVGTDGILLGAWADAAHATRILDVGTGSGLIALMLAQRSERLQARIDAIEIDRSAANQAAANVAASKWNRRIQILHRSLQRHSEVCLTEGTVYDLLVCNPPFFDMTRPPDSGRRLARHQSRLSISTLFKLARQLLAPQGKLEVVLPWGSFDLQLSVARPMALARRTDVYPRPEGRPKRVLASFSPAPSRARRTIKTQLILETAKHHYTAEFKKLTAGFHLAHPAQVPPV